MQTRQYVLETGIIADDVEVVESVIRWIARPPLDDDDTDTSSYEAQGRLRNTGKKALDSVVIDVSYYDARNDFLGLDKTGFADPDEMDPGGSLVFSVTLEMPEGTTRCVLNVSGKRMGFLRDKL